MPKTTVDQCIDISARRLMKRGWLVPNARGTRGLRFNNPQTGKERGAIGLFIHTVQASGMMRLLHGINPDGTPYMAATMGYSVELTTTALGWGKGKLRWWFLCPQCARKADLLYLPIGSKRFACRCCHGLGYRSSQESGRPEATIAA